MQDTKTRRFRPRHAPAGWRRQLAEAIRDPDELCDVLRLGEPHRTRARIAARIWPLVVPHSFVARMRPGDPHDPLLRQALPLAEEALAPPGFRADPVADLHAERAPGLLQKYASRVLLITTGACAIHCRYCFRRHFPYHDAPHGLAEWEPALTTIAADSSIHEVILSGGDPLVMTDDLLARLASRLDDIAHLRRLRLHTRVPIVIPDRVDEPLIGWLTGGRLRPIIVVHANHPNELDDICGGALRRLLDAGITVLNQSVLLRGVNDDVETLVSLSERLVDLGVMPYYLHQLDRVVGAAHFEVSESVGKRLVAELARRLPGYAVPRYVREIPGAPRKMPLVEVARLGQLSCGSGGCP